MKRKLSVWIKFSPVIYKDDGLHWASQNIGATECLVAGKDKTELFRNIKEKIEVMCSEAIILDDDMSKEYNQWRAEQWHKTNVPEYVENIGTRDLLLYALPYSENFKQWLRKNN